MQYFWFTLILLIFISLLYSSFSSRCRERQRQQLRQQTLPHTETTISLHAGQRYEVQMSDGKRFTDVEILGFADNDRQPFAGWEGAAILRLPDGKKAYVRQSSIRYILER